MEMSVLCNKRLCEVYFLYIVYFRLFLLFVSEPFTLDASVSYVLYDISFLCTHVHFCLPFFLRSPLKYILPKAQTEAVNLL